MVAEGVKMSWMTLVGAGISAYGAIQSGNAAKKAYNVQADEQDRQARDIEVSGAQQATEMRYKQNLVAGSQTEAAAAGGVSGGGSVLELAQETSRRDATNLANLAYNTQTQAYTARVGAASSRFAGAQAQASSRIRAVTALTAGVGQFAGTPTGQGLMTKAGF